MAVTAQKVRQWIAAALSPSGAALPTDSKAFIQTFRSEDEVNLAWSRLKACRDAGNSLDLDLAAAEHYLFARFVANSQGDTHYRAAPKFYETAKSFITIEAFRNFLKTSNQPVSPVDPDVMKWGETGVEDGLAEYERRTGQPPSPKGMAEMAAVGFVYGLYYTRYRPPQNFPCDAMIAPVGVWNSTDAGKRWEIDFSDGTAKWSETGTGGVLVRNVALLNATGFAASLRIERQNDDEVLTFLGFSQPIRGQILTSSPKSSYMILYWQNGVLTGRWSGLSITKDNKNQLKEIRQPGETPPKTYEFLRSSSPFI